MAAKTSGAAPAPSGLAAAAAAAAAADDDEAAPLAFHGTRVRIEYGAESHEFVDVTAAALAAGDDGAGWLVLPASETARANMFGDPCPGVLKVLLVHLGAGAGAELHTLAADDLALIEGATGRCRVESLAGRGSEHTVRSRAAAERLVREAHARIVMRHSSMAEELPEQQLAAMFVRADARVLELGCNVGRNTLLLACVLGRGDASAVAGGAGAGAGPASAAARDRLVGLECGVADGTWAALQENLRANACGARVLNAALSRRPLVQSGWNTRVAAPHERETKEWRRVDTLGLAELRRRVAPLRFDTLVVDCEGALYGILCDFPALLDGVHTVVIENDFRSLGEKRAVDGHLRHAGLRLVYAQALPGTPLPCAQEFFQVWKSLAAFKPPSLPAAAAAAASSASPAPPASSASP